MSIVIYRTDSKRKAKDAVTKTNDIDLKMNKTCILYSGRKC